MDNHWPLLFVVFLLRASLEQKSLKELEKNWAKKCKQQKMQCRHISSLPVCERALIKAKFW
jgi:hypothetical protein